MGLVHDSKCWEFPESETIISCYVLWSAEVSIPGAFVGGKMPPYHFSLTLKIKMGQWKLGEVREGTLSKTKQLI